MHALPPYSRYLAWAGLAHFPPMHVHVHVTEGAADGLVTQLIKKYLYYKKRGKSRRAFLNANFLHRHYNKFE